jgi:hypothetical protein
MSLAPVLLGLIPFAVFLIAPPCSAVSGLCIPRRIIGLLSPMPDYMDVRLILPPGAEGRVDTVIEQRLFLVLTQRRAAKKYPSARLTAKKYRLPCRRVFLSNIYSGALIPRGPLSGGRFQRFARGLVYHEPALPS